MVIQPPAQTDDELDPLEQADSDDQAQALEDAPVAEDEVIEVAAEEEEVVKVIDALVPPVEVVADDGMPVKPKPHMISQELIDRKLTADDWMDKNAL
jgi:hypothetical protein